MALDAASQKFIADMIKLKKINSAQAEKLKKIMAKTGCPDDPKQAAKLIRSVGGKA